ncbi:MAG: HAMP domain-containing histidine kinase [Lentisphaerales bacterium]|nr:HAMP domain-containing histidine kinase [Lentisphaerales bacterium]
MQKDSHWYEKRISFLEQENRRTLIALSEINSFESYFTDISEKTKIDDIYHVTCDHLNHFIDFTTIAFMNLDDSTSFDISFNRGTHDKDFIQKEVDAKVEQRAFAKALKIKNCLPVPLEDKSGYIILHALHSKNKILGMFIGIHSENILETTETVSPLLSVLLRKTGHFLSLQQKCQRLHCEVSYLQEEVKKNKFALDDALHKASIMEVTRKHMLANISHEFRTPLNAIIGLLDLMRDSENLIPIHRDYISTASKSASLIISLIDDLLTYVKLKSSDERLSPGPGSIPEVLNTTVQREEAYAVQKGLNIKLLYSPSLEQLFYFDVKLLVLILQKLLSNAIKFTHQGHIELTADLISEDNDLSHIEFKMKDTGIGFNAENFNFLCQPFTQEDPSTTRSFEGMGIGLALASLAVETLGSSLKVSSQSNEGSTFSFELKLSKSISNFHI